MKRTIALTVIFLLAMIWAACSIDVSGVGELRLVTVLCVATGDTITVETTDQDGSYYIAGCGDFPDSVVVLTP